MNTINQGIQGNNIYEYLLILLPHQDLQQKIQKVKNDFFEKFNAETGLRSRPHVTLAHFFQHQTLEEKIVGHLHQIGMGFQPIKIELRDFGSFPTHTIYINVASKLPIQNLVRQVRTQTQKLMKLNNENKPHFMMEPYIPIALKLKPWQYERGWLEYSHKHFTGRFIADAMLLLKRPAGTIKYEIAQRFEFQNLPIAVTTQGELFS